MLRNQVSIIVLLVVLFAFVGGCRQSPTVASSPLPVNDIEANFTPVAIDETHLTKVEHELKETTYTWRQVVSRDGIRPIYDPMFVPAVEAPFKETELVIGLEINGEAKAYPIGPLNGREMVNDTIGGIPVLVSW